MESIEEFKDIKSGQKGLKDHKSFWIGGSTNAPGTPAATIAYSQYKPNEAGSAPDLTLTNFSC